MTASQLEAAKEHDLLDLGAYVDGMKEAMAEAQQSAHYVRSYHISRPLLLSNCGRVVLQSIWMMTEGLN